MFACLPYGASVSGVAPLRQLGSGQRAVIIGEHFKNGGFSFLGLMIAVLNVEQYLVPLCGKLAKLYSYQQQDTVAGQHCRNDHHYQEVVCPLLQCAE